MVKNESEQTCLLKKCYGTSEWSDNSSICRNCKLKKKCGEMNLINK